MLDAERLDRYVTLIEKKRALEADLRALKEALEPIERELCRDMQSSGTQRITRNGWTVHLVRELSVRAKGGDTVAAVEQIRKARLGHLIGIHWPRIRAWVKERCTREDIGEWVADVSMLPPSLRAVIEVEEFFAVRCRQD